MKTTLIATTAMEARRIYENLCEEPDLDIDTYNFERLVKLRWRAAIENMYGGFDGGWGEQWITIFEYDEEEEVEYEPAQEHLTTAVEEALIALKNKGKRLQKSSDRQILQFAAEANDMPVSEILENGLFDSCEDSQFYVSDRK